DVPTEMAAELRKAGRPDLHVFPGFGTAYMNVNCKPKFNNGDVNPLAERRVRQALVMAIDKQNIVDTVTRMGEMPATTYIPPNIFEGYKTTPGLPRDVARAEALLAEAGFLDGRGCTTAPKVCWSVAR